MIFGSVVTLSLNLYVDHRPIFTIANQEHVFKALTIIDTVTNFPEIIHIDSKSSAYIAQQFENAWLSHYPQPVCVICDQGPEFKGEPFSQMLWHHGIHMIPTSVKNPQANAICEHLHQTIGNVCDHYCMDILLQILTSLPCSLTQHYKLLHILLMQLFILL